MTLGRNPFYVLLGGPTRTLPLGGPTLSMIISDLFLSSTLGFSRIKQCRDLLRGRPRSFEAKLSSSQKIQNLATEAGEKQCIQALLACIFSKMWDRTSLIVEKCFKALFSTHLIFCKISQRRGTKNFVWQCPQCSMPSNLFGLKSGVGTRSRDLKWDTFNP